MAHLFPNCSTTLETLFHPWMTFNFLFFFNLQYTALFTVTSFFDYYDFYASKGYGFLPAHFAVTRYQCPLLICPYFTSVKEASTAFFQVVPCRSLCQVAPWVLPFPTVQLYILDFPLPHRCNFWKRHPLFCHFLMPRQNFRIVLFTNGPLHSVLSVYQRDYHEEKLVICLTAVL